MSFPIVPLGTEMLVTLVSIVDSVGRTSDHMILAATTHIWLGAFAIWDRFEPWNVVVVLFGLDGNV